MIIGVVIGIAAVTTIVSIGQGASKLVSGEFEALGTNVILVFPGRRAGWGETIGCPDTDNGGLESIGVECPAVLAASPIVGAAGDHLRK